MKVRRVLLLAVGCSLLAGPSAFGGELFVGASKVELRLPPKVPLAGYSKRRGRPSTGQRDPLYVRAVAIAHQSVIISCELLIIDDAIREAATRRLGRQALIGATHTHSGPGAYGRRYLEKLSMGHYDQRVFDAIVDAIVAAGEEALRHQVPARWELAVADVPSASRNRMREDGPVDPEVIMVRFVGADDRPIASLVTAPAHPTVLDWQNRELSGDYPGYFMRAVEAQGAGSVCLFFPGAIADQAPVTEELDDRFERARRLGERLAAAALSAPVRARGNTDAMPSCMEDVPLPPTRLRLGRWALPRWLGEAFLDRTATVTVLAVDRLRFLSVPGDLSSEIGRQWKEELRRQGYEPILLGFTNDYIGYILPAAQYDSGEYEAQMMFNGPTVANTLWQAIERCHATLP